MDESRRSSGPDSDTDSSASLDEASIFAEVAEHAIDPLLLTTGGKIEWIAPSVVSALGWAADDLISSPLIDLVSPDDQPGYRNLVGETADGLVHRGVFKLRTKAGDFVWTLVCLAQDSAARDADTMVGYLREMDLRVTTETELREELSRGTATEARLRAMIAAVYDPIVYLKTVRDGGGIAVDFVFVEFNDATCAFYGIPREALAGASLLENNPAVVDTGLFDMYRTVVADGESLVLDAWEYPQELAGGELRYYDVRAVKVDDGVLATWRDVTDRLELIRKASQTEERYRRLAENVRDAVMHVGGDGRVKWVSPSLTPMLGWEPEQWIGHPVLDFVAPEQVREAKAAMGRVQAGESVDERRLARASDGTNRWLELRAHPFEDAQGHQDGHFVTFRVIDEIVEFERELSRNLETLKLAREVADIGVWSYDLASGRIEWDERMCELYEASSRDREEGLLYER